MGVKVSHLVAFALAISYVSKSDAKAGIGGGTCRAATTGLDMADAQSPAGT